MSNTSRYEYLDSIRPRYVMASKSEKNKILDEFCRVCEYNRKYAIRLLNENSPPKCDWEKKKRGPKSKYNHPDLINNMWDGSSCNDETGAYLGGCLHGYDFEDDDKNPEPSDDTHGTLIAGVIASTRNNNQGVLGVAPHAKIMALKHDFYVASEVMAIDFAIQNGAKVINASFTATSYSQAEYDAINRFLNAGGLFIAASGNQSSNNESTHRYPSDLDLANIISVTATNQDDNLSDFSNYGSTSVDVGAPGENIYSTNQTFSVSNVMTEDFESVTPPAIPSGWSESGTFGTYDWGGDGWKVLYGDLAYPYSSSNDSWINTDTYNLNGASSAYLEFYTECDTEYILDGWADYMVLEFSSNGTDFDEIFKWDEPTLDFLLEDYDENNTAFFNFGYDYGTEIIIDNEYLTSNFKMRFRWVTDSDSDTGTGGDGCFIDDIEIQKSTTSSFEYEHVDGTSFAAPYTAGLAALLWSIDNSLTYTEVRNAILNTGDTLSDLVGKTTTGKRINAYNAIQSFNSSKEITSFNFTSPSVTGVINEGAHTVSLEVPYGTDVTSLTPTITITGASVSPASGISQNFSSPVTYTVTAVNSTTQDYIVTVTVEAPSTVVTVSSGVYTVGADSISDVLFDTSKATFLSNITKDNPNQTWDDTSINDPVLTGDSLVVTAQDGTTTKTYTVNVDEVTPILDPIGDKSVDELTLLTFTATSTDPDGPSTNYYLTGEPSGASIGSTSGVFTFTPTEDQGPDTYYITVSVTDGTNIDFEDISITVNEANVPPVAETVSDSLEEDGSKTITLNANDSDIPSNTITYSINSGVSHGTLGALTGNQVLYTPDADYNGDDSFTYKANDGSVDSNIATVNITVNPVNDEPTANSDSYDTDEDTAVLTTLTGDDIDGDSLSFNLIDTPTNGSLEVVSGTQLNYIPDTDYVGSDSFTFKANDGLVDSNVATISITIGAVDDTPELDPIGDKAADELSTLSFTATATDPDSAVTYSLINAPAGASIGSSSGAFTFTPTEIQGPNSYTLTVFVTDGNTSDEEEITITVNEVNVIPTVNSFSVSTDEDTEKVITLNYTDPDFPENTITYTIDTGTTHGSLGSIIGNQITYTPNSEYNGPDSFIYKVNDGSADSNLATVTITVVSINDAPTITTTAPTTATEDVLYSYDADVSDVDGPSAVWTKSGADTCGGSLDSSTGNYTFTPLGPTPIATCEVSVTVSDYGSPNLSETQTTTITITAVNNLPISVNDNYSVDEDTTLNVVLPGVLDNDSDPEGSEMSAVLVSDVSNGSLSLNSNGSFEYIPNSNYYGADAFTYKVSDGTDFSSNATVDITVNSINDAPIANSDSDSTDEDTILTISKTSVLTNDTDVDDDHSLLTVQSVSNPVNGSVHIDGADIIFTPSAEYSGAASFDYTVSDGHLSDTTTVDVTVNPVNDSPTIDSSAPNAATEDVLYTYDAEVTDPDGPSAVWSKTGSDTCNGSLDTGTGYYSFTPTGPVPPATCVLSIKVDDGAPTPLSDTETVTISITEVNDAPTAYGTSGETNEDNAVDISLSGTDPENDALTYLLSVTPSHGSVSIASNVATYTPDPGYNGTDSFEFRVNDGSLDSNNAAVTLTITGVNDAPVIEEIADQTIDEYFNLQIIPVVSDVDGGTPTFSLTNAFVPNSSINTGTGLFNFTPDESQGGGSYYFEITANDGNSINNLASEGFTITVDEINNSPTAVDDAATKDEDTTTHIAHTYLLENDTDPDNVPEDFSIALVSNALPFGSSVVLNESDIEFSTPLNFNGTASFEYTMTDGNSSDVGLVTVTVNPVNDTPVAEDDSASLDEDTTLIIAKTELLDNDDDVDEDSLNLNAVLNPVNGTALINGDNVEFTPNVDYNGPASFDYTVTDGTLTDTGSVLITVNPVNDPPVLDPVGNKGVDELNTLNFIVTAIDVDTSAVLSYSLVGQPVGASINSTSGNFTFTPTEIQGPGSYTFSVYVSDGFDTDYEEITATVNEVNTAPVAYDLSTSTNEDTSKIITLNATDEDLPENTLTYSIVSSVSNGSLGGISTNHEVVYTPAGEFNGTDSFTYKVNDSSVDSNVATVTIDVTTENDAPVISTTAPTEATEDTLYAYDADVTDVDGPSETWSKTTSDTCGGTLDAGSGVYTFTPLGPIPPVSCIISIRINDGGSPNSSDIQTTTVNITAVNDAPVANADGYSVNEDSTLNIGAPGILVNDYDPESSPITTALESDVGNGTLSLNGNGSFTYTPNEDFFGADSFMYKVHDGTEYSNIVTVDITVNPINDAPVANTETSSVDEDITLHMLKATLLANDTDIDDDHSALFINAVSAAVNGTVIIDGSNVAFTPNQNYNGPASFDYTVSDGSLTDETTVNLTINPVNDAPTANGDSYFTAEDTSVEITLTGSDVENDTLIFTLVDPQSNGILEVLSGNQLKYTPNENYVGTDSFTFKAKDGEFDSNVATINITISEVNDPPVLDEIGNKVVDELNTLSFTANATDSDSTVTYYLTNEPAGASIGTNSGDFSFTPTESQGPGLYTLRVYTTDGNTTDFEEITVTVNEVNALPTTYDVSVSTDEDTSKLIILNGTDTDLPENTLTYFVISTTSNGALTTITGNEITYTPASNFNGTDSFTYKVNDGLGDSNTSTVTISVNAVNDAPVGAPDTASVDEDNVLIMTKSELTSDDTDVDLDVLSLISVSNFVNGSAFINGGNVEFTPDENFYGTASFNYTLYDGFLTDITTVTITVNSINDAPTASNDTYTTTQEASITVTLLGNDLENDSLTYSITSDPANGTLSVVSGNQVTYTPDVDFVGDDSFTYMANDGEYDSNESTIVVTVYPPPVISGESSSEIEDTSITITWTTDHAGTSRVIYDTVSHSILGSAPNYGYAYSTNETNTSPMVTSHSVTVDSLSPETTYYFRAVSHGSPEVVGDEISFTTKSEEEVDTEAPDRPENVDLTYNSEERTIKVTWENNDDNIDEVSVYMGDNKDFDKNSDSRITKNDYDDKDVTVHDIEPGETYYFKLVAEDKAGNDSKTRTVSIEIPEEPEKEVIVTDIYTSTLGTSDESTSLEDTSTTESKDRSVLGTETGQEEALGKTAETEEPDTSNGFKYFLLIGLPLIIAIGIFLKKRR